MKAYRSVVNPGMGNLMTLAEDAQNQVLNSMFDEWDRATRYSCCVDSNR